MIRQTVAHVDLDAVRANYREIAAFVGAGAVRRAPPRALASSASSRPMPTAMARPRSPRALEAEGVAMLACADIEEGIALAAGRRARADPGVRRAERQRSRRHLRARADPDDLDARRGAGAAGGRGEARRPAVLPSQDRHRDEPSRIPPRQSRPDAARGRRARRTWTIAAVYTHFATADDPDHPAFAAAAGAVRARRWRGCRRSGSRRRCVTPPTARRCCATSGSGTTSSARACCSTGSCRRRWRRRCGCDLPCHSDSRIVAVKGLRPGEGTGYGLRTVGRGRRPRWRSCRPGTPTASTCGSPAAATCWCAAAVRRWSARCAWT